MIERRQTRSAHGAAVTRPFWSQAVRALREASGVTQDVWAGLLGYGRKTVQRWEAGESVPDAAAESALVALCRDGRLLRRFDQGPLAGQTVSVEWLAVLLAEGRLQALGSERQRESTEDSRPPPLDSARPSWRALAPPTSLIGREHEMEELVLLLDGSRLLTLTGPGGVGKTRLALAAAERLHNRFGAAVVPVSLASLSDAAQVVRAIAQALGVQELADQSLHESLIVRLRGSELLLLLDNFEHVLPAATLVADMLNGCPQLHIIVTSRTPLHLQGEQEVAIRPLPVPREPDRSPLWVLQANAAVQLFVARGRAVLPAFVLSDENCVAVAQICRGLDGLPLAIELAAARLKLFSPAALLARLDHRLAVLVGGSRDLPVRQQTLSATINWSYELLSEQEQRLLRHLSVFPAGCTIAAIEAICSDLELEALDLLQSLVDKSLLLHDEEAAGEPRFRMLETVREFAGARLTASAEADAARRAHARFFRRLPSSGLTLAPGQEEVAWHRALDADLDNIRAAMNWSLVDPETARDGLVLAGSLFGYWSQGHLAEGRDWLCRILDAGTGAGSTARALALYSLGQILLYCSGYDAARPYIEECISLGRALKHELALMQGLILLATARRAYGPEALPAAEEAVELAQRLGDRAHLLHAFYTLGTVAFWQGDLDLACAAAEEAIGWGRGSYLERMISQPLRELGNIAYRRGDFVAARGHLNESLSLFDDWEHDPLVVQTLASLGRVALAEGRTLEAELVLERAHARARRVGGTHFLPPVVAAQAAVALAAGDFTRAARGFGAAEALGERLQWPMGALYRGEHDAALESLRSKLGEVVFQRNWDAGRLSTIPPLLGVAAGEAHHV